MPSHLALMRAPWHIQWACQLLVICAFNETSQNSEQKKKETGREVGEKRKIKASPIPSSELNCITPAFHITTTTHTSPKMASTARNDGPAHSATSHHRGPMEASCLLSCTFHSNRCSPLATPRILPPMGHYWTGNWKLDQLGPSQKSGWLWPTDTLSEERGGEKKAGGLLDWLDWGWGQVQDPHWKGVRN